MKTTLHLNACLTCIVFSITACEKQKTDQVATASTPRKPDAESENLRYQRNKAAAPMEALEESTDDPAERYFQGYLLIRQAEATKNASDSMDKYLEALDCFRGVKEQYPDWKTAMVDGRIQMIEESLKRFAEK